MIKLDIVRRMVLCYSLYYEHLNIGGHRMKDIIREIEAEQLRTDIADFKLGDSSGLAKAKRYRERLVFEAL